MWNVSASMSEFKYACPVCSQHIKCDSSQAGTVMECPTCFQKIIAPQAPADADQKLILTGTKLSDRPPQKNPELNPYAATQVKGSSGAVVVIIILACIGAAAAFVYRGTIFKPKAANPTAVQVSAVTNKITAPVVSDANWTLNLAAATIPDSPAAGRIHGQDFAVERAYFSNGTLTLRDSARGPVNSGIQINFSGAAVESLAGKTLNILANTNKSARVTLHWKDESDTKQNENFENNYALRLEFGSLTNNHLSGKIYLCLPDDQKSYLAGTFNADARKPKPKKTAP
jgi:hypothetical protein